jgi:acetolactate synthase-1/2/3 large subunit
MKRTGTEIIVQSLLDHGVDLVFGYPGATILPLYVEMSTGDRLMHVLTSHEQGATHAADGYARVTGRVGVVIATSGPGSTNTVTGIATAYMDSVPLVVITGNVPCSLLGTDSFQEVDTTGVTMPITKHSILVKDVNKLKESMDLAFRVAQEGRPGPVLVDVPKDVQTATATFDPAPPVSAPEESDKAALVEKFAKENDPQLDEAAAMINEAKKPMILIGGGVVRSGATAQLLRLAELLQAPVSSSLMGLGAFPASHPLYVGNVGMHGNVVTNTLSGDCDLFIAIGTRFNDRIFGSLKDFLPEAKVLHIDIDRAEISKNVLAHKNLVGDAGVVIDALTGRIGNVDRSAWAARMAELKKENAPVFEKTEALDPPVMMRILREKIGEDATVATDVGQHQMWVALHVPFEKPRRLVTSGGMGTMGFGLGAAIGAQMGLPGNKTLLVTGDGSFRMNCNELATVANYNLPLTIVLMNNGTLGMVRQWQTLFYDKRYYQTTLDRGPDFVKLADAYGVEGHRIDTMSDFESQLEKAVAADRPVLLDCRVDIDAKVRPMVGPGKPITDFVLK